MVQYSVTMATGPCSCSLVGDYQDCVRVTFSFHNKDNVRQGVENLVKVVRAMQAEK